MSNNSNDAIDLDDTGDGELAVLEPCGQCGKMVPPQNMMIHQLTACSTRTTGTTAAVRSSATATSVDTAVDLTEDDDDDNDDDDDDTDSNDSKSKRRSGGGSNNNTSNTSNNNNMDMDMDTVEVVDLVDSPPRSRRKTSATSAAGGSSSSSSAAAAAAAAATTTTTTDLTLDDSDEDDDDDETDNDNDNNTPSEWACPKCTLLNSLERSCCEACNYKNPNYVRPPDSTRTEQLVGGGGGFGTTTTTSSSSTFGGYQQQQAQYPDPSSSPMTLSASAGAGALLGGLIGAAGNYVQGRSLTDGLVDGAMTGAIGGAIFHNATSSPGEDEQQNRQRQRQRQRRQRQQESQRNPMNTVTHTSNSTSTASGSRYQHHRGSVADARSSSAMGMAAYPSTNTRSSSSRSSRQQPRNSYRSVQTINPDGSVTTTTTGGGRSTRSTSMTSGNFQDPMVQLLLHQQLAESAGLMGSGRRGSSIRFGVGPTGFGPFMGGIAAAGGGGGGANIDGMSYEQLLARFGDGSENRGADDSSINRLPVKKLEDPQKELPEDARQCMICLEDFGKGETRMTLPCLHGFHSQCCTKWLRQNGTCPICKSNVDTSDA